MSLECTELLGAEEEVGGKRKKLRKRKKTSRN